MCILRSRLASRLRRARDLLRDRDRECEGDGDEDDDDRALGELLDADREPDADRERDGGNEERLLARA